MVLRSVSNFRARFKSYPSLDLKNLKKISIFLPTVATAKKNSSLSDEYWIDGSAEKNAFFRKVLSRVSKFRVGTVQYILMFKDFRQVIGAVIPINM